MSWYKALEFPSLPSASGSGESTAFCLVQSFLPSFRSHPPPALSVLAPSPKPLLRSHCRGMSTPHLSSYYPPVRSLFAQIQEDTSPVFQRCSLVTSLLIHSLSLLGACGLCKQKDQNNCVPFLLAWIITKTSWLVHLYPYHFKTFLETFPSQAGRRWGQEDQSAWLH